MAPINFIGHAVERMTERGISEFEVLKTLRKGKMEPAKNGRLRFSFEFSLNINERKSGYKKKVIVVIAEKKQINIDVISVYKKFY